MPVNVLLSADNHLFELARSGQRLPHAILATVLSFIFVLLAQVVGGVFVLMIVVLALLNADGAISVDPTQLLERGRAISGGWLNPTLAQTIVLILLFGPIFPILWMWLALAEKRPFWTIGLEKKGAWWRYLRGLLIGLLIFGASIGISASLGYIAIQESNFPEIGPAVVGSLLLAFLGWMVQGAAEEALTRGWLLPVIGARYTPLLGVAISALIFALFHSLNPNLGPIAVLNLALFGVFTALYALYERGIWGVFGLHSAWNWAQLHLFGFEVSGNMFPGESLFDLSEVGPDLITGGAFGPEGGLSVTIILVISCIMTGWFSQRRAMEAGSG